MPVNILMPALSPTMEEGKLAAWMVSEGDTISAGDVIAEIETDKATMEVEAVDEGTLGKIVVPAGTEGVKVNQVIAVLLEEGESAADIDASGEPSAPGLADEQADVGSPAGQAPTAVEAPASSPPVTTAPAAGERGAGERVFSSPLARRIARDRGIDLATIKGSGPRGRIVKADVEHAEAKPTPVPKPSEAPSSSMPGAPVPSGPSAEAIRQIYADRNFEEITLDGMRKTIAARLSEAKSTIPHFYLRRDIELDELLTLRAAMNKRGEARGIKLSVNDFVIKACALALQEVPAANAVWAGDRVLQFEASDVAVAVAIEGGLFTPVIRDAHAKSLSVLSAEMRDLATRARDRKLAPNEYQGGAFAISNLGMFGIENFDAVINPPHASILAVGAGIKKPIVRDDALAVATVMSVTLSVDHRVIDGALGAEFLGAIKGYIEDPMSMLM